MQDSIERLAMHYPWVHFLAIAILPGLGVPNCPLLIICGTAMSLVLGIQGAVMLAVGAVLVNILWTYWVAAYPFREMLIHRVDRRVGQLFNDKIQMNQRDVLQLTFLLHITPGVPLFIQNYYPGLHRLAFWKYLAIAVPVQSLYTTLIVITSGQIFSALRHYPIALLIVLLAIWIGVTLHRRSNTKSPAV